MRETACIGDIIFFDGYYDPKAPVRSLGAITLGCTFASHRSSLLQPAPLGAVSRVESACPR